jgi:hypothetical protein
MLRSMKKTKGLKQAHTDNTKYGMGDYYGTGVRSKIGKMRDGMGMQDISPKKLKSAPKSLA